MQEKVYRIITFLPEDVLKKVMDSVNEVIEPLYPHYDYVFSWMPVKGCWRPLDGANPYLGKKQEICYADEIRLEFCCKESNLREVLQTLRREHPYEEPVIDVIYVQSWKDFV